MSNTNADRNTTIIAEKSIVWWLRGEGAPKELDEASIEHIQQMVKTGYREGELYVTGADDQADFRGWWQLEQPADNSDGALSHDDVVEKIAAELREADPAVLIEIYDRFCSGELTYQGDSLYQLKR
jgi:hypothetical protein